MNLVALRAILFIVQEVATGALPEDQRVPLWLAVLLVVTLHGGLFIWQAVGLLRATDHHSQGSGQMFKVWGTQLALIVATLWILSYSLEAWHLTQAKPPDAFPSQAEMNAERAAKYSLTLSDDNTRLSLEGTLELGVTAQLAELLAANPDVARIHLTSLGGNIFEARGLAALIRSNGLSTSVDHECSSACTLVFIGGRTRQMASDAKLGFHQYRLDTEAVILSVDPEREQERDLAAFRQAGVAPWFLEELFQSRATEMWYPPLSDLQRAGVVTEIVPR